MSTITREEVETWSLISVSKPGEEVVHLLPICQNSDMEVLCPERALCEEPLSYGDVNHIDPKLVNPSFYALWLPPPTEEVVYYFYCSQCLARWQRIRDAIESG